jgi:phosphoribosylaminoimidazole-succinocarboxamide synthase
MEQTFTKNELLYEGKAKKIYSTNEDSQYLIAEFKDDLTAFNAQKKSEESGKGALNNEISSLLFEELKSQGIESHFVKQLSQNEMLVKKVDIILIEVVVRNTATGSLSKRLEIEDGKKLPFVLVEFYYKRDDLNDPIITDEHAIILDLVQNREQLEFLKESAREVNKILIPFFDNLNLNLIDFKLEYGITTDGKIILADELSPDNCRFWDKTTNEKMDKDRFRHDLGSIKVAYEEVRDRILNYKNSK